MPQRSKKSGPEWKDLRIAVICAVVVGGMVGAAYASVPLYNLFCRVTGFGGTTQVSLQAPGHQEGIDRVMTVRFDASKARDMPWDFKPEQVSLEVPVGEQKLAFYEAYNPTDRPVTGTASYNVTPPQAGYYFSKVQCFCFTDQTLQPGERMDMPVSFYIDPDIVNDDDLKKVDTITLSYTFYETKKTAKVE